MVFLSRRERERQMAELVNEACHLVGSGSGVRSVRIVARGRPIYAELRRYRESAQAYRVRLFVDDGGVITVWPEMQDNGDHSSTYSSTALTPSHSPS